MTAEELTKYILAIDEEHLNDAVLQQLIKYTPQQNQLAKLEGFRKDYDDLHEAEKFALTVSSSYLFIQPPEHSFTGQ